MCNLVPAVMPSNIDRGNNAAIVEVVYQYFETMLPLICNGFGARY